jgi:hypothetical protein
VALAVAEQSRLAETEISPGDENAQTLPIAASVPDWRPIWLSYDTPETSAAQ